MFDRDIKITGAGGGGINLLVEVTKRALEELGYTVEIDNPHPENHWNKSVKDMDDLIEHVKKMNKDDPDIIKIVADHLPWGG